MYTGVYLSLKGVVYPNNSVILITEIGETDPGTALNNGLQCITDRMPCCRSGGIGVWQDPNGRALPTRPTETLYRNRGDDGMVNLNRLNGVTMPTGRFCCVVPDATATEVILCTLLGKNQIILDYTSTYSNHSVSWIKFAAHIRVSDDRTIPLVGESYTLTCTVSGTTFTSYQWRKDGSVISGETGPTLSFSSARLIDAGRYSCGNGTLSSANKTVIFEGWSTSYGTLCLMNSSDVLYVSLLTLRNRSCGDSQ